MAGNDAASKLFQAWNETTDALIDAVRAANDRGHRFSTALIEESQEAQRTSVELAKKWAAAPFDLLGLYGSIMETARKAQGRALDVSRQWYGEMAEIQKETRDYLQRVTGATRTAGEGTVDVARSFLSRATEAMQSASSGNGRTAPAMREPRSEASSASV